MNIKKWDIVKINGSGDLYFNPDNRPFIGQEAIVRQITKGGLYIVELKDGRSHRFAKKNLDMVKAYDPDEAPFPVWTNQEVA